MRPTCKLAARTLGALAAAGLLYLGPATAYADVVDSNETVVISDDISNRTTNVTSSGDGATTTVLMNWVFPNNGHGNNEDGVDSSNPGNGGGGPGGSTDASCDGSGECVDDESTGGGKNKNK